MKRLYWKQSLTFLYALCIQIQLKTKMPNSSSFAYEAHNKIIVRVYSLENRASGHLGGAHFWIKQ